MQRDEPHTSEQGRESTVPSTRVQQASVSAGHSPWCFSGQETSLRMQSGPCLSFSATQGGLQHLRRGEDTRAWEDSALGILLPVWVPLSLQGTLSVLHAHQRLKAVPDIPPCCLAPWVCPPSLA